MNKNFMETFGILGSVLGACVSIESVAAAVPPPAATAETPVAAVPDFLMEMPKYQEEWDTWSRQQLRDYLKEKKALHLIRWALGIWDRHHPELSKALESLEYQKEWDMWSRQQLLDYLKKEKVGPARRIFLRIWDENHSVVSETLKSLMTEIDREASPLKRTEKIYDLLAEILLESYRLQGKRHFRGVSYEIVGPFLRALACRVGWKTRYQIVLILDKCVRSSYGLSSKLEEKLRDLCFREGGNPEMIDVICDGDMWRKEVLKCFLCSLLDGENVSWTYR